jgi:hypothetical protein
LRDLKQPVPKDLVKACSASQLRKIQLYRSNFSRKSQLSVDARELAETVIGDEDGSFRMGDVVRLHNHLNTLFVLYTCDSLDDRWYELFRSDCVPEDWEVQPVDLDPKQRPVISLYYTPLGPEAGHVDFICDAAGLASALGVHGHTLCPVCLKTYRTLDSHKCIHCPDCDHLGCTAQASAASWAQREYKCDACNMRFKTQECFNNHKLHFPAGKGVPQGQSVR